MNFLVRDTKYPNREPFLISQLGFDGLRQKFGTRYIQVSEINVHKELGIVKVPTIQVTPKGTKKVKGNG